MHRIAEQRHRSGHQPDGQLDETGQRKPDGAESNGAVGLTTLAGIVDLVFEGKAFGWIADSIDGVHVLSMPRLRGDDQPAGGFAGLITLPEVFDPRRSAAVVALPCGAALPDRDRGDHQRHHRIGPRPAEQKVQQ
jgi:hypothetical protein